MISPDSTSYPVLATIQTLGLTDDRDIAVAYGVAEMQAADMWRRRRLNTLHLADQHRFMQRHGDTVYDRLVYLMARNLRRSIEWAKAGMPK